jgi:hypothetical protein
MSHYRLIAIDIDGTLLDSRSQLRPAVRAALERALAAGVHVVLCTGRRYRTALPVAQDAGLALPVVCHSGALVKDTAAHRTLVAHPLPSATLARLLDALDELRLTPFAYTDTFESGVDFYVARGSPLTLYHEDYLAKNEGCYRVVDSLRRDVPEAIIQMCTFAEAEVLPEARREIAARLGDAVTIHLLSSPFYIGRFLEFQAGTASKWDAVLALARGWGIPVGDIVAIGDNENDIAMLRGAGLGVAMGNADYAVKSAAHVVTATNDEDGVARVIEKLLDA